MKTFRWFSAILSKKFLNTHLYLFLLLGLSLFIFGTVYQSCAPPPEEEPTPPEQPESGPGGAEYSHADVIQNTYGEGEKKYWLFEPTSPAPSSAPLIVFFHGWGVKDTEPYIVWIRHIVRRGNIVVYPIYQERLILHADEWTSNAIQAVKDAITQLQSGGHVQPELDRFAIVGHSLGAAISANVAALAVSSGLPEPDAVMVVQPGSKAITNPNLGMPLEDFSLIPEGTLMLVVVGGSDDIVGENDAQQIYSQSSPVSRSNKDYITVVSDHYGEPSLRANHYAPVASENSETVDALDYYGYWKLFDGLTDAAFYDGKNREYALGNTPEQRFMGYWSDGMAVNELKVTEIQ